MWLQSETLRQAIAGPLRNGVGYLIPLILINGLVHAQQPTIAIGNAPPVSIERADQILRARTPVGTTPMRPGSSGPASSGAPTGPRQ